MRSSSRSASRTKLAFTYLHVSAFPFSVEINSFMTHTSMCIAHAELHPGSDGPLYKSPEHWKPRHGVRVRRVLGQSRFPRR